MKSLSDRCINIIGFSLTGFGEKTSFGSILETNLRSKGWKGSVREISYGGLSIDALSGLIESASTPIKSGDMVGLELSTSSFSLQGYKVIDALPYIFAITKFFVQKHDLDILFLNLFRNDLDDNDSVVQAIRIVSSYFNIRTIDLKTPFRNGAARKSFGTTDGVHPDIGTRECIAIEIEEFLESTPIPRLSNAELGGPTYEYFDLASRIKGATKFNYQGRGKSITSAVAFSGEEFDIDLEYRRNVVGLYFLYGPETGYISVSLDGADEIELITYDENSYYRRVGFRNINKVGRRLKIKILQKTRDIRLVRDTTLIKGPRSDFLCGLSVKHDLYALPSSIASSEINSGKFPSENSMTMKEFDSLGYWITRHEKYLIDPRGVGNAVLDVDENQRIYKAMDSYISDIVKFLSLSKPVRVLDLGCGTGMLAGSFIRVGCDYTGIDISKKAIEIARASHPTGRFDVANIAALPLSGKYDIVIERTVFIHLVEDSYWRAVIGEVKRLLSGDGVFILIDHLPMVAGEAPRGAEHVKFRLYGEYEEELMRAGLRFDLDLRGALASRTSLSPHTHLASHANSALA